MLEWRLEVEKPGGWCKWARLPAWPREGTAGPGVAHALEVGSG